MRPYGQQPTTLLCSWDSLGKNTRVVPFPSPPLPHGGLYKPMTWYTGKVPRLDVGFHCSSDGKESACNAGDLGSIPRSGRSPREGNGNPLQYCCLENSMDRGAWQATAHGVTKSQTQLTLCVNIHTLTHHSRGSHLYKVPNSLCEVGCFL